MITKKATIDGTEYVLGASGYLAKLYREKFGRDMVVDMRKLIKAYTEANGDTEKLLELFDGDVFERMTWAMLKHADQDVPDDLDDWLKTLNGPFSIYPALPAVMELMHENNKTTSVPRKK